MGVGSSQRGRPWLPGPTGRLSTFHHFCWGSWAPMGGSLAHPSLSPLLQLLTKRGGDGEIGIRMPPDRAVVMKCDNI